MERVGILLVSYGSREAAMVDVFKRSRNYAVDLFIVDKQRNPFNVKNATEHTVVPDLNINEICRFAKAKRGEIDFGIVGPEKPITEGIRDTIEKETKIPMICPTKEYAIEESKIRQRVLFDEIVPDVNPRFKIFDPDEYATRNDVEKAVYRWLDELENQAVVKPDKPAAGKGVGVWGDHFTTREELFEYFLSNYQHGKVIIEEKIEGEESSFQAFCDGKHVVPLPDTRDYKRAFDGDKGPNTGGMGSYKDNGNVLPFLDPSDREEEENIVVKIFQKLSEKSDSALRGVPFYVAFMHTAQGPKILENNSRPGDPEIINILPVLKDDFVDVCYSILEGSLTQVNLEKSSTVVTYKVPPSYGGYADTFPKQVDLTESVRPVDLSKAMKMVEAGSDHIRIYPGAMEQRDGDAYALKSRAVCAVGIGEDLETARSTSLSALGLIEGGGLWNRNDIASKSHIENSRRHMENLRHAA